MGETATIDAMDRLPVNSDAPSRPSSFDRDTERVSEPRFFGLDHCLSKTIASRPRIIELLVDRVSPNGVTGQVSTDFHPSGIKSVPHRSGSVYQESL